MMARRPAAWTTQESDPKTMQKKRGRLMLAEFVYICILLFVSVPCDVLRARACVRMRSPADLAMSHSAGQKLLIPSSCSLAACCRHIIST